MNEARNLAQLAHAELAAELRTATTALQDAAYKMRLGQEKRVHLLGQLRRRIARIKTLLAKKSPTPTA